MFSYDGNKIRYGFRVIRICVANGSGRRAVFFALKDVKALIGRGPDTSIRINEKSMSQRQVEAWPTHNETLPRAHS